MHGVGDGHEMNRTHAAPLGLVARGLGKGRAEHGDRGDAAALQLDRVGDADRGRGSTISEALHDGIAFGELGDIRLAEVILRRRFADDRPNDGAEPTRQLGRNARQKEIRVELAVIDEAEALACEVSEPGSGRNRWGCLGDGRIEHGPHIFGSYQLLGYDWIQFNPKTERPQGALAERWAGAAWLPSPSRAR